MIDTVIIRILEQIVAMAMVWSFAQMVCEHIYVFIKSNEVAPLRGSQVVRFKMKSADVQNQVTGGNQGSICICSS